MPRLTDFPEAEAALDRRLDGYSHAPIALALSGGGDSIALLIMARRWAARRGRAVLALTVDHQLNLLSPSWTAFAGSAAQRSGADWRALTWTGPKPSTGLPAAARAARHRLLADAARAAGASVILFAHTADDVAEGEHMRAADAPTLGYLREWSPSPAWPEGREIFVLRPLLGVRRNALRAWLSDQGADWLEDPANDDLRYARARARAALTGAALAEPAMLGDDRALAALGRATQAAADGRLAIRRAALLDADPAARRRFLAMAAICASGRATPPRGAGLDRLQGRLDQGAPFVATLAGARIVAEAQTVSFSREAGEWRRRPIAPLRLEAGQTSIWDGRFEIAAEAPATVTPTAGSAARLCKTARARLLQTPACDRPALPLLWRGDEAEPPRPFGEGPALARPLAGDRLRAACGLISQERDIPKGGMAQSAMSSYVDDLALA